MENLILMMAKNITRFEVTAVTQVNTGAQHIISITSTMKSLEF